MKEVRLSDSSVNSYGYRVLTNGIDIEQYTKNPILLFMHNRPTNGTTDEIGVIGKMTNLRIEKDALIGTPEFNLSDPAAAKIAKMWENDILNMVSIGADIIETSSSAELMLEGQTLATVTKCKLREVSIVDIGANDNAIKLSFNGENDVTKILSLKKMNINVQEINKNCSEVEQETTTSTSEQEILADLNARLTAIEMRLNNISQEEEKLASNNVDFLIDEAIKLGKINADKKLTFREIGMQCGAEILTKIFDNMPKVVRASNLIDTTSSSQNFSLHELSKDQLNDLYNNNRELYKELYAKEYGITLKS